MQWKPNGISRRDFIKTAGLAAGGAILMPTIATDEHAFAASSEDLLTGVSDIHIHAAPDSRPRSIDELGFAREAQQAGYRAVMYKSNDWSCHDRAFLIRNALPGFEVFGSIIMNRLLGDRVNPYAAEQALRTTGKLCRCIWMPTLDAAYQCAREKRGTGIPVLDASGRVLPEVVRVMEICAEADIIFATGHSSQAESLTLARKAREVGVGKFVATHVNSLIWTMTPDQIRELVDLGGLCGGLLPAPLLGSGNGHAAIPRNEPGGLRRFRQHSAGTHLHLDGHGTGGSARSPRRHARLHPLTAQGGALPRAGGHDDKNQPHAAYGAAGISEGTAMDRRTFLKSATALAAAGGLQGGAGTLSHAWAKAQEPKNIRNYHEGMRYRPHGLTGVSVSALGFGMLRLPMLADGKTVDEA